MAQISYLWTTSSSGDGAATYTRSNWSEISKILGGCSGSQGIVPNYLNCFSAACELETLIIHSGGALVDGKPMRNTTSASVTIPAAVGGGNTRIDRVTLRAMWNAGDASPQTVRIWRIEGIDAGAPTVPDLVQTAGSTYDLPLWQATVNTAGTITAKTDERYYSSCALAGQGLQTASATGELESTFIRNRQGNSATVWSATGTTNYTVTGESRIQCGVAEMAIGTNTTITFPVAFSYAPIPFLSAVSLIDISIVSVSATTLVINNAAAVEIALYWLVIGPK